MGRMAPGGRGPGEHTIGDLAGNMEQVEVGTDVAATVLKGWAVDSALPRGGWGPVTVLLSVDQVPVAAGLASEPRPDLV